MFSWGWESGAETKETQKVQTQEKNNWIKHLDFIVLSLLALIIAFTIAYAVKFGDFSFVESSLWRTILLIMCLFNLIITFMMSPYSDICRRPHYEDVVKLLILTIDMFVLVSVFFYVVKLGDAYSRTTIILTHIFFFILSNVFTYIRKKMILSRRAKGSYERIRKILVIAERGSIEEVRENVLASDVQEYEIVGFAFVNEHENGSYDGKQVIDISEVADYVTNRNIDDVFIAANPAVLGASDYRRIVDNNATVHLDIESMMGIEGEEQFISQVGVYKTASVGPYTFNTRRGAYMFVKRFCDIVFALIGCIFLLPLMAIVKISNIADGDHASIIYCQTRVGKSGEQFKMYKFRSMISNADEVLQDMLKDEKYRCEWDQSQKFDDDPRITKAGRFLRKTSLDEFPQFVNVLKGDMSLVGPRPLVVGELEEHDGLTLYNRVKPGITGWWACNGRSNISYKERLELEYYYVKNRSLYLDLLIIVRTAIAVFRGQGAQ